MRLIGKTATFALVFSLVFFVLHTADSVGMIIRADLDDLDGVPWLYSAVCLIFSILAGFIIQHEWDQWNALVEAVNGAVGALTKEHPLQAKVGETLRIFFGVGGPNLLSSFHVIGEHLDRVYDQASLTSPPVTTVQTTLVPPSAAALVEPKVEILGRFLLVDHALSRLEHGLLGFLQVEGTAQPDLFHEGGADTSPAH